MWLNNFGGKIDDLNQKWLFTIQSRRQVAGQHVIKKAKTTKRQSGKNYLYVHLIGHPILVVLCIAVRVILLGHSL